MVVVAAAVRQVAAEYPERSVTSVVEELQDVTATVARDKAFVDAIEKLGDEVRFMSGPELSQYWDKESEENIKILLQLQKEGVKLGE